MASNNDSPFSGPAADGVLSSASKRSIRRFIITEKAIIIRDGQNG